MSRLSGIVGEVFRYLAWIALSALGLWAVLQVRINMLDIAIYLRTSRWAVPAVDKFFTIPLILIWLAAAIGLEHYLIEPREYGVFWRRAVRVAVFFAGVLATSYALQALI